MCDVLPEALPIKRPIPNNLMPFIAQVAVGRRPELAIFGDDYPTEDGTCVRDYLHVMDLAAGHVASLASLEQAGVHLYNLGTGQGVSVLEMVRTFELATGQRVPYRVAPRRDGDLAAFWADAGKAERGLEAMLRDTWRWQERSPQGYGAG